MPVFAFKDPTSSDNVDMLNYTQELVRYLKYLLEHLDETNIPSLKTVYKGDSVEENEVVETTYISTTLAASEWLGLSAPYEYTFSNDKITAESVLALIPSVDITAEQLEALQYANITGGLQAAGNIVLKAWGEMPIIDIPVTVVFL